MSDEAQKGMSLSEYMDRHGRYMKDERYESVTCLYRYFDINDGLLYVGISNQPEVRDQQHWQDHVRWRFHAVYMTIEVFPTRGIAEIAEQRAIMQEEPEFNRLVRYCEPIESMPGHKWYLDICGGKFAGEDKRRVEVYGYEPPEGQILPHWKPPVVIKGLARNGTPDMQ